MRLLVKYSGRRTVTLLLAQRQNLYFCHRVLARRVRAVAGAAMAGNASRIPDRSPSRNACTGPAACCLTGTAYAWSAVMQLDGCRASRIVSTLASVRSQYDHCNRRRRMWPLLGSIVRATETKNDNKRDPAACTSSIIANGYQRSSPYLDDAGSTVEQLTEWYGRPAALDSPSACWRCSYVWRRRRRRWWCCRRLPRLVLLPMEFCWKSRRR